MKKLALLTVFLSGALIIQAQSFKDFTWLTGTWERQNTKAESSALEVWEKLNKAGLKGLGVSLRGTDTVFAEKLSLVKKDDSFYYVAEVSQNSAPTYFKITSYSKNGFVCENPDHDFPKKIDYKLEVELLTVVISGDGEEIPFIFRKVD
jgi:hypothetical protein